MRENGSATVFIRHDGDADSGFLPNTPGWHLLPSLNVDDQDAIIAKTACDAFCETHLESWLKDHQADHLIICGWATDYCVDTTVRSAASRGYRITVVKDAHTVADREHLSAAQIMEHHHRIWSDLIVPGESIKILSTDEVIQNMTEPRSPIAT